MSDRESLRGVPFRLSKKFYPLIRPQFRDIDIHIPLDALEDDYDFSLERQMIVKCDSFLEEKERLRIKHEERLAEEKRRQEELAAAAAVEAAAEAERLAQLLMEQVKIEAPAIIRNDTGGSCPEEANVRLSDFEADTANPFDSAELKSMNDKAELASIWGKVLQDQQQALAFAATNANRSSPSSSLGYPMQQSQIQAPPWNNHVARNPNGSLYYEPIPMAPSCSPVPPPPSLNVRPTSNDLSSTATTINSSLSNSSGASSSAQPPNQTNPAVTSVSTSNSFTKLHFPFLSSYTQANTRDRELERALERSYHEHYHLQQQQNLSSSAPQPAVPSGVGFNPAVMHQPGLSSSSSASNLQTIPTNFNIASGVNSSHSIQNQPHNNFIVGHNYNWPITTTYTPPYEYSHVKQPTKK